MGARACPLWPTVHRPFPGGGVLPKGGRAEREPPPPAAGLVRLADVAELVGPVASQLLQVVELADVDPLLRQQVAVYRDERLRLLGRRRVLQAAGVRADQDRALLLDQPLRRRQVDARAVVLPQFVV